MEKAEHSFTKYEVARIVGARALQIAMDAPLLLKVSESRLKEMNFDALQIAEEELNEGVLPIAIDRPSPRKHKEKLAAIKEETLSDEELIEKEKELEKEIIAEAKEIGLVNEADDEESFDAESENNLEEQ